MLCETKISDAKDEAIYKESISCTTQEAITKICALLQYFLSK